MTEDQKAIINKTGEITTLTDQLDTLIETCNWSDEDTKDTLFDHIDEILRASRRIRTIARKEPNQ